MEKVSSRITIGLDIGSCSLKKVVMSETGVIETQLQPLAGRSIQAVKTVLAETAALYPTTLLALGITHSGSVELSMAAGVPIVSNTAALVAGLSNLCPQARTVIEIGAQSQRLLFLVPTSSGRIAIQEILQNLKCAAGSGSFLSGMATRLEYQSQSAFAEAALKEPQPASLSGRCSVFAESDVVHLYQKGVSRERIAAGIHKAVVRNLRTSLLGNRKIPLPIYLIGGVAANQAIVRFLAEELGLTSQDIIVPSESALIGAFGAAYLAEPIDIAAVLDELTEKTAQPVVYASTKPLSSKQVELLSPNGGASTDKRVKRAGLGIDIGSVSTKAVVVTEGPNQKLRILASDYRKTAGNPINAVKATLGEIDRQLQAAGIEIDTIVAATTGSGRYMTADVIGADLRRNEITAQAMGTVALVPDADTVFEIGGQDSKYIRLNHGAIVDYEMNRNCAAGCGAFLEKLAQYLGVPIDNFGPMALAGSEVPVLDPNCTVFTEAAVVHCRQNNVGTEDLCAGICLASVHNYLSKVVANRHIGDRIVFQGAVARNQGMAAAFSSILGKVVTVPPYPHLTGCIGAAVIAYREAPATSQFRGFANIQHLACDISSFVCRSCGNHCDVNRISVDAKKPFFYNDRCERFSGNQSPVSEQAKEFPDLFQERESWLLAPSDTTVPDDAKTVGIPRGLYWSEYYPLYRTFFEALGYKVVPSSETTTAVAKRGIELVQAEPCYPIKVAYGHVDQLVQEGVDFIFLPAVLETEQPDPRQKKAQCCPYIQSAPETIAAALGLGQFQTADQAESGQPTPTLLTPRLYFNRGRSSLLRALNQTMRPYGHSPGAIEQAFSQAEQSLATFRQKITDRGREVLSSLKTDDTAFVVFGRPYTLGDPLLNMRIGKKIRDLGILALPMDFLPLDDVSVSDRWDRIASRQIQRRLAAAQIVRQDPRLHAVVLGYFGCGPDSFANLFFSEVMGDKPFYVNQLDEHTADAGVITRLEAYDHTVRSTQQKVATHPLVRPNRPLLSQLDGRMLWVPQANRTTQVFVAALQAYGVNAHVLPASTDSNLSLARSVISEDVCIPSLITTEDILRRTEAPDFNPANEAFFQGRTQGPCRYGMYHLLQEILLKRKGFTDTPVITIGDEDIHGGLGQSFIFTVWDGLIAHDLLEKLLHATRPYELRPGQANAVFSASLQDVCAELQHLPDAFRDTRSLVHCVLSGAHLGPLSRIIADAAKRFSEIDRRQEPRPLVGIVGEFFVRLHTGSNLNLVERIEALGGEVWLSPASEFFGYVNHLGGWLAWQKFLDNRQPADVFQTVTKRLLGKLAVRDEHCLFQAARPYLTGRADPTPFEIMRMGSGYLHPSFGGDALPSMGSAYHMQQAGADGLVNVGPFNCMPSIVVRSQLEILRQENPKFPILNLEFNGYADGAQAERLEAFINLVKQR